MVYTKDYDPRWKYHNGPWYVRWVKKHERDHGPMKSPEAPKTIAGWAGLIALIPVALVIVFTATPGMFLLGVLLVFLFKYMMS